MPSIFGHTVAGLTISAAFTRGRPSRRVWILATVCAVAPDLDWFTGFFPLAGGSVLAHRGASHSLAAAVLITAAAMLLGFRSRLRSPRHWLCMASATFSHGLLDACTFGGTGVAFLLPFSDARYVCVWQPIYVSPIPLSGRLLNWLLFSFGTEVMWIGIPALVLVTGLRLAPRIRAWARRALAPPPGREAAGLPDSGEGCSQGRVD